jgi:hypothetical protein
MSKRSVLSAVICGLTLVLYLGAAERSTDDQRAAARKLRADGNYRDAYRRFRWLALGVDSNPKLVGNDLEQAVGCLSQLNRRDEVDALREEFIERHAENWRALSAAARSFANTSHRGHIVAGEFYRGNKRGGGRLVNSFQRDRVRALQLMQQALPLLAVETDRNAVSQFYLEFSRLLSSGRGSTEAWSLQHLTNIDTLPDYEEGYGYYRGSFNGRSRGAPVDTDGKPVLHHLPDTYETAQSDGERWRWMLNTAVDAAPHRRNEVDTLFADFLRNQFGVRTMRNYYGLFSRRQAENKDEDESGPYALHTLGQDETIARLATGIKRFQLPDEFNFIKIYQNIAADGKSSYGNRALNTLAEIFEDRRQYPAAAGYWQKSIAQYGPGREQYKKRRLHQIVSNWGRFEGGTVQPAGRGATVDYRFRNGSKVTFHAYHIKVDLLLADVKAYLKSQPAQLSREKMNINNIGYRLVHEQETKYRGGRVANWEVDLKPREDHFDTRTTITTPLEGAGAYLVTAKMHEGNMSRIVVWLSDTVIARKQLDGRVLYYLADAVSGTPVAGANVEFFGYRQESIGKNRYALRTTNFAEFSNADGLVIPDIKRQTRVRNQQYQWLVSARTKSGRFAHLGFNNIWFRNRQENAYDRNKAFVTTDRPVYRPGQPVKFKFWIRNARYDNQAVSHFADRSFTARIINPKSETVFEKSFRADEYGGFAGEFLLADEVTLGQYALHLVNTNNVSGGGHFRVEEYKKPEFEVTVDAPAKPVMLGEKITATVRARYYFGAPVTEARVHYKVQRSSYSDRWYPFGTWDWLYGGGYWWFSPDYTWYRGWQEWGCLRPTPFWWPRRHDPPEVVLDDEVAIGEDGTVQIEIDTALAKAMHGDLDHRYRITAEVVDQSRRTIVGSGQVLVARKPFKVFAWLNRGHFRAGDAVTATFQAQTLDQKPVAGNGTLKLLRVTYDEQTRPVETEVELWDLNTNERGEATQKFTAASAGQYRLSYTLNDGSGHSIEGGYLFTVFGEGFDGSDFQFNDLELLTDKREYQPGDKVRLMINTNRVGGTVLLFVRPVNGVCPPPQVVRLTGKSTVHEIAVVKKDMPNFFVEALSVSGGKIHAETREIVVPPEKRIVNVDVLPSQQEYRPAEQATIRLKLTDLNGRPFTGSTALTIYDKSVEYISGGSNVAEIKAFFWKFRRTHHPSTISNLNRYFRNLLRKKEAGMNHLGAFGDLLFDAKKVPAASNGGTARGDRYFLGAEFARSTGGAVMESAAAPVADAAADFSATPGSAGTEDGAANLVQPTVRTNFAETAYWSGSIISDENGIAEVALTMPESLTTWKIRAWTMGHGTQVGEGQAEIITTKKLLVRMQAPRFFTETDEVVLSANVHNYLDEAKEARVELALGGETLSPLSDLVQTIEIPAGGERRVDWRVKAAVAGVAVVRMNALTDEESDAVEMNFGVEVHGMLKTESFAGVIRPDGSSAAIDIDVPSRRQTGQTRLEVRFSPTLAGAMVDALPYLISYPYKTSDTTMNRFLPSVIVQNILKRMNLDLGAIQEKRTNLNAQEIGDDRERAAGWKRYDRNPVFDEAELARLVKRGVNDLTDMQLPDGGWRWYARYEGPSDPHTTALVVHGLQIAAKNNVALVPGMLERAVAWLKKYQETQARRLMNAEKKGLPKPYKKHVDNLDAFVFMVLVDAGIDDPSMRRYLYRDRTDLSVYAKAMFGLALAQLKDDEKLTMIVRNIDQFLVENDENQTAYLKLPQDSYWWHWYGSEIEANAYYLKLLARTAPRSKKAAGLVKYLLNNRKHATYWSSTRDTAIAVEAMAEYLVASGEDRPDLTVTILFDGKPRREVKITAENLFTFDNSFLLTGEAVASGRHTVELRKSGGGPLYFNAYLTNFTLEEQITRAGLELKVNRKFYRLVRNDETATVPGARGQVVKQQVEKYRREELTNFATLDSGDVVEIELEIDSKNDYEYLVFEDMKAAGFEPVALRSGYNANDMGAYMELRDRRVTFFARRLARGKHSVSYRVRAEVPGQFSALPTKAYAMYAPELKGNSDEIKILITDGV